MRFAWTVAGDDVDFAVGDRHGVNGYFYPAFDALSTKAEILKAQKRGHVVGLYVGAGWWNSLTPQEWANKIVGEIKRLNIAGLRLMVNLEEHNPTRILEIIEHIRSLMPTLGLSWSMEPNQGGWMGPDVTKGGQAPSKFVQRIVALKVRLVPQLFFGGMAPAGEDGVMWDLACRGFPASALSPFYDGAALPWDADGYIFTLGRLP